MAQVVSCKFYEIFNTFFTEHLRWLLLSSIMSLRLIFTLLSLGIYQGSSIKQVRSEEGRGDQAKSLLARMGEIGGSAISIHTPYFFFAGSLQNRNKIKWAILIAKIIHFHLSSTVKKCKLDPRALLGVLVQDFLIAMYNSFFIM